MKQISEKEKIDCLRLIRSENVGPATFYVLLKYFGTAGEALRHINDFAKRGGRGKPIKLCSVCDAEKEFAATKALSAKILTFCDIDYPDRLRAIPDAPPIITVLGQKQVLKPPAVAIIGTRDASLNGRNMARKLAFETTAAGFTVVSGMALGIDSAAHEGSLEGTLTDTSAFGGTIAVLGSGIDTIYPPSNKNLYDRIKHIGLLVSEFALSSPVSPSNFPRRNRIISGLANGVTVVEARLKSGSLITAKLALEQGREVLAIPGSPLDTRCQGTNYLLKNGAVMVEKPSDIISFLKGEQNLLGKSDLKEPDDDMFEFEPKQIGEDELTEARKNILTLLGNGAVAVDELIRLSSTDAQTVNIVLVELELAGKLERLAGNFVNMLDDINEWK